jgi:hypothetical protein
MRSALLWRWVYGFSTATSINVLAGYIPASSLQRWGAVICIPLATIYLARDVFHPEAAA